MKTNITNTHNLFMWLCPQQHRFLFLPLLEVDLLCRLYMPGITHNIKRPHKNPKPKIQFALNFGRKILWDINLTKATTKPQTQKLIIHIPNPIKFPIMGLPQFKEHQLRSPATINSLTQL